VLLRAWIRLALVIAAGIAIVLAGIHVGVDVGGGEHESSPAPGSSPTAGGTRTVTTVTTRTSPTKTTVMTVTVTETHVRTHVVTEPPTGRGIHIAYGAFAGKVRLVGAQWHPFDRTIGAAHLDMQAEYTGNARCRVAKSLGVTASLFDTKGTIAETSSTDAFDLARGVRVPITIRFFTRKPRGHVDVVVTGLTC
jgi:hypothetical protein